MVFGVLKKLVESSQQQQGFGQNDLLAAASYGYGGSHSHQSYGSYDSYHECCPSVVDPLTLASLIAGINCIHYDGTS